MPEKNCTSAAVAGGAAGAGAGAGALRAVAQAVATIATATAALACRNGFIDGSGSRRLNQNLPAPGGGARPPCFLLRRGVVRLRRGQDAVQLVEAIDEHAVHEVLRAPEFVHACRHAIQGRVDPGRQILLSFLRRWSTLESPPLPVGPESGDRQTEVLP